MKTALDLLREALRPEAIETGIAGLISDQKSNGRSLGSASFVHDVVELTRLRRLIQAEAIKVPA